MSAELPLLPQPGWNCPLPGRGGDVVASLWDDAMEGGEVTAGVEGRLLLCFFPKHW